MLCPISRLQAVRPADQGRPVGPADQDRAVHPGPTLTPTPTPNPGGGGGGGGGRRSCRDTMVVVATRHPFDWVASLYRNTHLSMWPDPHGRATPARLGMSLQAFVRAEAPCPSRGNRRGAGEDSAEPFVPHGRERCWRNPLAMWKRKLEGYARLAEAGCAVVATRFLDTTANGTLGGSSPARAACAIVLADVGDNQRSARLWKPSAVQECAAAANVNIRAGAVGATRAGGTTGGGGGGGRVIQLEGGGSVAVGLWHHHTVGWSGTVSSWANASLRQWMADELADLSPTAKLMTNYRYYAA